MIYKLIIFAELIYNFIQIKLKYSTHIVHKIIKLLTHNKFFLILKQMNTTKSVPNDFQIQKGTTWIGGPTH